MNEIWTVIALVAAAGAGLGLVAVVMATQLRQRMDAQGERLRTLAGRVAKLETEKRGASAVQAAEPIPVMKPLPDEPTTPPRSAESIRSRRAAPVRPGPRSDSASEKRTDAPDTPHAEPQASLEERLGARVFVWIGGVALALAGAYMAKYSFDRGLLSPEVRLWLGAGFGVALIGAAQWLHARANRVAQAACGAGVAVLFGVLLAAVNGYGFIGPWLGFGLMATVTAGAVGLALRHGQFVALLGLVGGFATPALIGGESMPLGVLLTYLFLLEAGLLAVTHRRGWVSLSAVTLLGAVGWAFFAAITGVTAGDRAALALFAIASAGLYVLAAARAETLGRTRGWAGLGVAAGLAMIAVVGVAAAWGGFMLTDFGLFALLGAGAIVLGRWDGRYALLPWTGAGATAALLVASVLADQAGIERDTAAWLGLGFGAMYGLGAYACLWRSAWARSWASLSAASGFVFILIAMLAQDAAGMAGLPWWAVLLIVGGVYAGGAWIARRHEGAASAMALSACGMAAWAIGAGMDHPWWALGWAGLGLGVAELMRRTDLRAMGVAVGWSVGLSAGVLFLPGAMAMDVGDTAVWNMLLWTYGSATALYALTAWRLHVGGATQGGAILQGVALTAGAATAALLVRHGFHGDAMFRDAVSLYEWTTYAVVFLVLGAAAMAAARPASVRVIARGGAVLATIGIAAAVGGGLLLDNPLVTGDVVGGHLVWNGLLYAYGLPAALALVLAWRCPLKGLRPLAGAAGLVLVFALISLEVRQGFVGPVLRGPWPGNAELYAYSLAWVLYGGALLALGVTSGSKALRYASLAVMMAAVCKVFVLDTSHLRDLYRVMSFLGLGLSLLGIGFVYHRWVFGDSRAATRPRTGRA